LLEGRASHSEVSECIVLLTRAKHIEDVTETANLWRIDINLDFIGQLKANVVHFGHEWKVLCNVGLATSIGIILDSDRVALSIVRLQEAWTSVADEPTVDHDDKFVAERFCLIHSVRSQNH